MTQVTCQISISLDGFVAGPNQSLETPLGEGGMRLHEWVFNTAGWRRQHGMGGGESGPDDDVVNGLVKNVGAYIMGRKMFGGAEGAWDDAWTGWWGDEPPYHVPVFVLTHHAREPLEMDGGTTFNFVTDGHPRQLPRRPLVRYLVERAAPASRQRAESRRKGPLDQVAITEPKTVQTFRLLSVVALSNA